jgi:ribose 5-phosphate isomerase RpiB
MKIAVVNEISTADRNADVVAAVEGRGHEVINAGMKRSGELPELTVLHTSFLSALLLATRRADFIVGGCGTGHGYEIAVNQYPGVFSGRILTPLDAWLFTQINGGNVVSLALNLGYGWAADVNVRMIFDALLSVESGAGYPPARRPTQQESRRMLYGISDATHRSMADIVATLPDRVVVPALTYPGIWELLATDTLEDRVLAHALEERYARATASPSQAATSGG